MASSSEILLIHYSEIGTKGRNRGFFERRLREDVRARLAPKDVTDVKLDNARLVAPLTGGHDKARIEAALGMVFGIAWFAFGRPCARDEESLKAACVAAAREAEGAKTFKVYVKRVDKTYPISSEELCRRLGGAVIEATGLAVDLDDHDLGVRVEILPDKALVFREKTQGLRGMPRGSSGRMMCLFSGGIDSPVAAWMMMRRGAQVDLFHFHPYPTNEEVIGTKITEQHDVLKTFNPRSVLYLAPHAAYQAAAALKVPPAYETVLFRRFMLKASEALSRKRGLAALVTGDCLGQVASQTLENMAAAQTGLDLPVFQPLISMDKDDIIRSAQKIGTFDLSNKPYKDCCSLMSKRPKTNVAVAEARRIETDLDLPALIPPTLAMTAVWDGKKLHPLN
jgi:thiamine biosynthesis protein ThiI